MTGKARPRYGVQLLLEKLYFGKWTHKFTKNVLLGRIIQIAKCLLSMLPNSCLLYQFMILQSSVTHIILYCLYSTFYSCNMSSSHCHLQSTAGATLCLYFYFHFFPLSIFDRGNPLFFIPFHFFPTLTWKGRPSVFFSLSLFTFTLSLSVFHAYLFHYHFLTGATFFTFFFHCHFFMFTCFTFTFWQGHCSCQ